MLLTVDIFETILSLISLNAVSRSLDQPNFVSALRGWDLPQSCFEECCRILNHSAETPLAIDMFGVGIFVVASPTLIPDSLPLSVEFGHRRIPFSCLSSFPSFASCFFFCVHFFFVLHIIFLVNLSVFHFHYNVLQSWELVTFHLRSFV